MADESTESNEVVEASAEEIAEAKQLGWADEASWRGKKEDWVDAKEFLRKGKEVLPMLQRNYERVRQELQAKEAAFQALQGDTKAIKASLAALEASAAEDAAAQVEAAKAEMRAQLTEALRDGDHAGAAELTEKIASLGQPKEKKEPAAGGDDKGDVRQLQIPPEVQAWYRSNPEFTSSPRHIALANGIAAELRGKGSPLSGAAFLDAVAEEVEKVLGPVRSGHSKVGAGNGGGGRSGGGGGGNAKSYADLPADAKAACDKMSSRLVGENRKFKTNDAWRKSYVAEYFKEAK